MRRVKKILAMALTATIFPCAVSSQEFIDWRFALRGDVVNGVQYTARVVRGSHCPSGTSISELRCKVLACNASVSIRLSDGSKVQFHCNTIVVPRWGELRSETKDVVCTHTLPDASRHIESVGINGFPQCRVLR